MQNGETFVIDEPAQKLPEYENPPINEVACGILFVPMPQFLNAYLGLLWEKYRSQYPNCQETGPIMPVIERFDGTGSVPQPVPWEEAPFFTRTWFVDTAGTGLIQIQRDRFLTNWRKLNPSDEYPRYHTVIEKFRQGFSTFEAFIDEHHLGPFQPLQYELTYVNHILNGEGWDSIADINKVFPDLAWRETTERFLPMLENVGWNGSFVMPNQLGRLHAKVQTVKRKSDGRKALMLDLTVRGIGSDPTRESMFQWFELAREWIVRGFADLTSDHIQNSIWRRLP